MKISNSKKELARIISENGGWRDGAEWSAQDKNHAGRLRKVVFYCGDKPWIDAGDDYWGGNNTHDEFIISDRLIKNWHQTILSRAEYFHLYPAPDAYGWIEWSGGECPFGLVDVKYANGTVERGFGAGGYDWDWKGEGLRIIAYRLHKPEQAKPEFCESVARSIPEPECKPSIEQLMQIHCDRAHALSEKKAELLIAERQESEALDSLKAACKEAGFDISPIEKPQESQEPVVITDWRDLRIGDRIWIGATSDYSNAPEGEYDIVKLDETDPDQPVGIQWRDGVQWPQIGRRGFCFIRRP